MKICDKELLINNKSPLMEIFNLICNPYWQEIPSAM